MSAAVSGVRQRDHRVRLERRGPFHSQKRSAHNGLSWECCGFAGLSPVLCLNAVQCTSHIPTATLSASHALGLATYYFPSLCLCFWEVRVLLLCALLSYYWGRCMLRPLLVDEHRIDIDQVPEWECFLLSFSAFQVYKTA